MVDAFDDEKIERGVRLILEGIGEDPDRGGLRETPARVGRMYREIFAGIGFDASELVTVVEGVHHGPGCYPRPMRNDQRIPESS